MLFVPRYRCEHCWSEENVLKLTNLNEYVCLNCIKKIYDCRYIDNARNEQGVICGELVPRGNLTVEEAIRWLSSSET